MMPLTLALAVLSLGTVRRLTGLDRPTFYGGALRLAGYATFAALALVALVLA